MTNSWIKYIILGIVILLFLGFNSYKFWERQDKADEMHLVELKHNAENDSLKMANTHMKWEIEQFAKIDSTTHAEEQRVRIVISKKSEEARKLPANKQFELLKELIAK